MEGSGAYGALFDAAQLGFAFPVSLIPATSGPETPVAPTAPMTDFCFWGPTCDSIDYMPGPFRLPDTVCEGDYIEIGNMGAYGRALAGQFNGYGRYDEVVLDDEPIYSMYTSSSLPAAQKL